ncbi:unnamed protein product [Schistosoma mattheei]|uniref:Uncharacterized protein n=1 Tax=Schistosoma mattheei TaxID=31246 RepID=A0A183NDT7_9TREM|nr:unnamed protein product [Schistosoma mattheei]
MLTGVRNGWMKGRGGQTKTWHQCLKSLTSSLSHVGKSVGEVVNLHRLRWLGHVSRMLEQRLPRRAMLTRVRNGWMKVRGGQTKTWHQCLKSLTSSLSHVGRCRLLRWGPYGYRNQWLQTLSYMTQNRSRWRRCIHSPSFLKS